MFCLILWACGLEFARPRTCSSVHMCCVFCCCTQFVFLLAACIHVMPCAVWNAACVFHGLHAFMLSYLVWTRCVWVFVSCFAHGGCFVLLAMCLCFCFVWAHGFCLSVPCALMSIVLTPPILFPDYWLICPTRFYLVTLLICSLHNLLVFAVLCQFVIAYILSCPVQLGQAWLPAWFPLQGSFWCCFVLFSINKSPSLCTTSPRLIPSPQPWQHQVTWKCKKKNCLKNHHMRV